GGDKKEARKNYEDPIEFIPICIPLFAVNDMPTLAHADPALFARIEHVPFNAHFYIHSEDRREDRIRADQALPKRLAAEYAVILHRSLMLAHEFHTGRRQPTIPAKYRDHAGDVFEHEDDVARFLTEHCETVPVQQLKRGVASLWDLVDDLFQA